MGRNDGENTIFIVGASHDRYQIRPRSGPHDGADEFKRYLLEAMTNYAIQTIAEEMSVEALNGRVTVCQEIANEAHIKHVLCDPTSLERQALGISAHNTPFDSKKREGEWFRRLSQGYAYPVLFVSGAAHVDSFAMLCRERGMHPYIVNPDFEASGILLDRQII